MKNFLAIAIAASISCILAAGPPAIGYVMDTTIPDNAGCPQLDRWNLSLAAPLSRQWSTSLPANTVFTAAPSGDAQLSEIEQAISDSFAAWSGVTGLRSTQPHIPDISPRSRV